MKRIALLVLALTWAMPAYAQQAVRVCFKTGSNVTSCQPVDATNPFPITGSFSAGTFAPGGAYATLTATGSSADVPLPSGAAVIAFNTGTTAVSCQLTIGSGVATASMNVIQASSWLGFTVGSNTHISCIDQTGSASNVVVVSGGSGSPTGAGGGGGGSGGSVTIADGAAVNLGALADSAWSGSGNGTMTAILKAIYGAAITGTATNGATYPGSSIGIGWKDGSNNIQPFAAATPAPVQPTPGTSGGGTPYHLSGGTAASNNSTSIKGSAGNLYRLSAISTSGTLGFLKVYDSALAPTCSSATGLKHVYPIPSGTSGAGINIADTVGESYASGIGFCVTGGGGDTDNSNAPTGIFIEGLFK